MNYVILTSIFFINIEKVNAEEYQIGDLVEIINHLDRDNLYYYTKQELQHKNYSEEKYVFLLIVIYINV